MSTRATMAEVAKAAGVSVSTVSRVLADKPDISEETRDRVTQAARATGYVLRAERRRQLGGILDLLIEEAATPWAAELVDGAQRAAFGLGYTLALTPVGHPRFRLCDWIDTRRARPSDGILLALPRPGHDEIAALTELPVPLVLLDPGGMQGPDGVQGPGGARESAVPAVGATNWSGGAAATRHLLELGHRRVGFLGGPSAFPCTRERYEGYLAAHREFSLAPDPALTRYGELRVTAGAEGTAALLALAAPPTAVFAGSDVLAAGAYQTARARGLRVPEDLSVVGFDDTAVCAMLTPPLTTVRQPLAEMAAEAVRLIDQEQARRGSSAGRGVELATSLVVRQSTAPRPAHQDRRRQR